MSLFVEGSHGEALKRTVVKSLVTIFSLLVPAACVLYLCGGWVLGVVGAASAARGAAAPSTPASDIRFAQSDYAWDRGTCESSRMGLGTCAWWWRGEGADLTKDFYPQTENVSV